MSARHWACAFAAVVLLASCGQRDNVTAHSQPAQGDAAPKPAPLQGDPQPAQGGTVFPGNHPQTPGGATKPGESPSGARPEQK